MTVEWPTYMLREKIFAIGEDFWVEDASGQEVYKIDGKAISLRGAMVLEDPAGAELLTIQKRLISLLPTMTIERAGVTLAVVRKTLSFFREHYEIEDGAGRALEAQGDFTSHEYELTQDGQVLATISRRWFALRDTFGVAVAPGQDVPLMLAIAVAIEEISEERRERQSANLFQ